jgi:hypothetical protein
MVQKPISNPSSKAILELLPNVRYDQKYSDDRKEWNFYQGQETILKFRPPINLDLSPEGYLKSNDENNYVLLLIRSGIASVGYFENRENIDHKVFRSYMVRKKQGKSQIKHLKTKGKSRAGSRVRLAETLEFFENINQRLTDYFSTYHIDRIGLSCSTTLLPYLFGSKVPTPFPKNDPRLITIPKHIQNPTYENLLEINEFMLQGEFRCTPEGEELMLDLLSQIQPQKNSTDQEDDDW